MKVLQTSIGEVAQEIIPSHGQKGGNGLGTLTKEGTYFIIFLAVGDHWILAALFLAIYLSVDRDGMKSSKSGRQTPCAFAGFFIGSPVCLL